jgi:hypothetical protein
VTQETQPINAEQVDTELRVNSKGVYVEGIGMVYDFMPSSNLNECVDELMKKKSKA